MSVYFAVRDSDGAIKIGTSNDVVARMAELAADERCDVRLLRAIHGGTEVERRIHEIFRRERIWVDNRATEWFRPSDELDAFSRDLDSSDDPFDVGAEQESQGKRRRAYPTDDDDE